MYCHEICIVHYLVHNIIKLCVNRISKELGFHGDGNDNRHVILYYYVI